MPVSDTSHSVLFVVLVRSISTQVLNGTISSHRRLSIIEPVVSEMLHVVGVHVADSLRNFRSRDSSAMIDDVFAYLMKGVLDSDVLEELVEQLVSSSVDLNLINVLSISGGTMHAQPCHLSAEDLVTEEPVSKESSIGVCKVMASCPSHVR